jgi:hypothetical protein
VVRRPSDQFSSAEARRTRATASKLERLKEGVDMSKKLRCYLNRHSWVRQTAEGQSYAVCRDCSETDWDHYDTRIRTMPAPGGGTPSSGGGG